MTLWKKIKRITVPLRPTLVTAVIMIIILTGLGVGISAYRNSSKSINLLWDNLSTEIANTTTDKTLDYIRIARPFMQFTESLTRASEIDLIDPFQVITYCASALNAFPHFNRVYYAHTDGSFYSAVRGDTPNNPIIGSWFTIEPDPPSKDLPTKMRNYLPLSGNKWELKEELWGDYDPRERPFWQDAISHPSGAWSKPYIFALTQPIAGITYSKPNYKDGKLRGIWLVDYFISVISDYLSTLKIGEFGNVIIIADDGTLIATAQANTIVDDKTRQLKNLENQEVEDEDKIISAAWAYLKPYQIASPDFVSKRFTFGNYLGYIQSFPRDAEVPWNVITVVPRSYFFGPIIRQAWQAASVAVIFCIIWAFLSALFFGKISRRLKGIAVEMHKVGDFDLSGETYSDKVSVVREVNMMNNAIDRMKAGLSSFAKYVPVALVSGLIRSGHPAVLGGKKAKITILFSDLANFTELSEKEAPDELVKVLDDYLSEMTNIIEANRGTVDKYLGDAIMAFWGAPTPLEEHVLFACRSALAMQEKANVLWKDFEKEHGVVLSLRIGINTGEVVIGNIGSSTRMDYTAIGDAVNLASRLEGLNKFYGTRILIGEETAHQVGKEMLLRRVDRVAVKGKKQASFVYELICEKSNATAEMLQATQVFEKALDLFNARNFAEAILLFEKADSLLGGHDMPSQKLKKRAELYLTNPPEASWDGTTYMDLK